MDSSAEWVIPLANAAEHSERLIGGKAAKLARLARAGFRVPDGFCIPATAYQHFVQEGGLLDVIRMELGRKPFESMRWEEVWDAALRIRSAFLARPVPVPLARQMGRALDALGPDVSVAVRIGRGIGADRGGGRCGGLSERGSDSAGSVQSV